jgi:type IV secretory pathway TrbL component
VILPCPTPAAAPAVAPSVYFAGFTLIESAKPNVVTVLARWIKTTLKRIRGWFETIVGKKN